LITRAQWLACRLAVTCSRVLLVLVAAGLPDRVGDRGYQSGGALAELPGQYRQGGLPGAAGRDALGVVFDGVVGQGRACQSGSVTR
jgi:hypothetical protein